MTIADSGQKTENTEPVSPNRGRRRSRYSFLISLFSVLCALVALGWLTWQRLAPVLPMPETTGFDPEVAAAHVSARDAVRSWPWSGERWGRFGLVLYAHNLNDEAQECFRQAEHWAPRDAR